MKTKLELATVTYKYLQLIADGYETGDFSPVFPYLAEDCVLESQWVLSANEGYDAVVTYLTGKGETLKRTEAFPDCSIQELVGNLNTVKDVDMHINGEKKHGTMGLYYPAGELCLLMEQTINDKTNELILRIQLNNEEKISRIDLCMPELFNHRCFYTYIEIMSCKDDITNEDTLVRVSEDYYNELALFLSMVGVPFDEYDDMNIPLDGWIQCLNNWKRFYSFKTFDEAFEDICGIDYDNFTCANEEALCTFSVNGRTMWNNRTNGKQMLAGLIEWTEKYKGVCDCIRTYGF